MKISPTYKDRVDLSTALKWKFTIEENIARNRTVRAWYRWYFFSPFWNPLERFWLMLAIPTFLLMWLSAAPIILIRCVLFGIDEDKVWLDFAGTVLWFAATGLIAYFVPYGFLLPLSTTIILLVLWFQHVMKDLESELYEEELSRKYPKRS